MPAQWAAATLTATVVYRMLTLLNDRWEQSGEEAFSNTRTVNLMNNFVAVIARGDSPRLTTDEVRCPVPWCAPLIERTGLTSLSLCLSPCVQGEAWAKVLRGLLSRFQQQLRHYHVRVAPTQMPLPSFAGRCRLTALRVSSMQETFPLGRPAAELAAVLVAATVISSNGRFLTKGDTPQRSLDTVLRAELQVCARSGATMARERGTWQRLLRLWVWFCWLWGHRRRRGRRTAGCARWSSQRCRSPRTRPPSA
jgi:hypothetical protein